MSALKNLYADWLAHTSPSNCLRKRTAIFPTKKYAVVDYVVFVHLIGISDIFPCSIYLTVRSNFHVS